MWNLQISNQNNLNNNNNVLVKDIDQNPDRDRELDHAPDHDLVNRHLIKVVEVLEAGEGGVGHVDHPLQTGATLCQAIWPREVLGKKHYALKKYDQFAAALNTGCFLYVGWCFSHIS